MEKHKKAVKAIVFDMDGTLLDTLQDLTNAVNVVLEKYHLPLKTVEQVCKVVGNGARNLVKGVVSDGEKHPKFEAIFEEYKAYYAEHCEEETRPYEGIRELLEELKIQEYKMAVVSNKPDQAVKILAEKYFPGCFQVAVGDREGYNRKPAPDLVYKALEELQVSKDDAIYVGDSDVDLMTAMNAELPCVSVTWGFRDREFLLEHGASIFIDNPMDLTQVLGWSKERLRMSDELNKQTEEFEEYTTFILEMSDKKKHEFAIVEEFDHKEKHYVLVSEVKGDEITEGVYLFRAESQGEDFIVEEIEDKAEYAEAVKAYEALYQ